MHDALWSVRWKGTGDHALATHFRRSDLIITLVDNEVELRGGVTSRAARITSTQITFLSKRCVLVSVGRNKKVRGLK